MTDVEKELTQLRKSVAHLRLILITMIVALVGCCVVSKRSTPVHANIAPDAAPDIITAKQFVVVDNAGNQSIVIGPIANLNSQQLNGGADFRGIAVFGNNHEQVASLGLGIPHSPASGADALHYSELFLQSEDGKSTQAYLRAFGPGAPSSTRLHLVNRMTDGVSAGVLDEAAVGVDGSSFMSVSGNSSNGGRLVQASSVIMAGSKGDVGLRNCPAPNNSCGPPH